MRAVVVTPPPAVIDLPEVKAHLRVSGEAEDGLIRVYLAAATAHIDGPDGWLGRSIGTQVLEVRPDGSATGITLPYGPIQAIKSVSYVDPDGATQTVDAAAFALADGVVSPVSGNWPAAALRIQYRAGYQVIPAAMRAAILLMVGDLYHNRETTVTGVSSTRIDMSATVEYLLAPFRVFA